MGGTKVRQELELNSDHLTWLGEMTEKYGLFDIHKALRVVVDHAIDSDLEEKIFTEVRCNHCQNTANQD